jgi:hypothetical protein
MSRSAPTCSEGYCSRLANSNSATSAHAFGEPVRRARSDGPPCRTGPRAVQSAARILGDSPFHQGSARSDPGAGAHRNPGLTRTHRKRSAHVGIHRPDVSPHPGQDTNGHSRWVMSTRTGNPRTETFTTHGGPVADARGWSRSQPNCAIVVSCTGSGRVNWPMTLTATWLRSIAGSPS